MTTATDIKFGKIDRSEPISAGGTGEMDILARTGGGEWRVVGSVEVDATCTHEGLMSSHDRYAVDTFTAYLHDLDHADITVECFGYAAAGRHAGQAVTRWGGRSPVRIYTAAEARRILKAKIAEALSAPEEPETDPTTTPTPLDDARALIGHKVRSFDFVETWNFPDPRDTSDDPAPTHITGRDLTGERACYCEGVVEDIVDLEGCPRYAIRVTRKVFGGKETDRRLGTLVFPPINGTPNSCDGVQNGVELVAPEAFPLCEDCVDNIGGAGAGPDAIWRPAAEGEACGAAYCVQDIVIEYNLTEGA